MLDLMSNKISKGHHSPGVGISVCVPTLERHLCMKWALAFKSLAPPINYNMELAVIPNLPVADARNLAAINAINKNHRYLFFLGDDVIVPNYILGKLIMRMEHDSSLGVVGGVYCAKSDPPYPLVFKEFGAGSYWNWKIGDYFQVCGIGMDATLIRVELLRKLAETDSQFFKTVEIDRSIDNINSAESWTEDLYFCNRVTKETNYNIYVDGGIICEHYDHNAHKYVTLPHNSYPVTGVLNLQIEEGTKKAVDIGGGFWPIKIPGYTVLNFDKNEETKPDFVGDVNSLPFENKSVDLVYSSHVLEHVPRDQFQGVLEEWIRIVKDDGLFVLKLPDLTFAAKSILNDEVPENDAMNVLYGAQQNKFDYHYNGFTPKVLEQILLKYFPNVEVKQRDKYNLFAVASQVNFNFEEVEKMVLGA